MDSQIFIAICLFFLLVPFSLYAYGAILRLTATKDEIVQKSKRMFKVGTILIILILVTIYAEMQNPTNPTVVHTADEFIKK